MPTKAVLCDAKMLIAKLTEATKGSAAGLPNRDAEDKRTPALALIPWDGSCDPGKLGGTQAIGGTTVGSIYIDQLAPLLHPICILAFQS